VSASSTPVGFGDKWSTSGSRDGVPSAETRQASEQWSRTGGRGRRVWPEALLRLPSSCSLCSSLLLGLLLRTYQSLSPSCGSVRPCFRQQQAHWPAPTGGGSGQGNTLLPPMHLPCVTLPTCSLRVSLDPSAVRDSVCQVDGYFWVPLGPVVLEPPSFISQGQSSAHSIGCDLEEREAEGREEKNRNDPLKYRVWGLTLCTG
jgi:hypothetical protein